MGLFTRKKMDEEQGKSQSLPPIYIKQIHLANNRDFMILRQNLQQGNIMICNLNPLFTAAQRKGGNSRNNHSQLHQLKQFCITNGGSISKLEDHVLLITPNKDYKIQ